MISFIVIGKNEGWRLEKCLQSIRSVVQQDAIAEWELIYIDSRSTDSSVRYALAAGARVFSIVGECNAAIARNIGAVEAKGEVLFFIDGDMEILSGFLPRVLRCGQLEYPFVSGIFNDVEYNADWQYVRTTRRHKLQEGDPDEVEATTGGLFLITHELWDRVGGMDTRFRRSQDYDLGLRLSRLGFPLHRKAIVLANHYMQPYTLRPDYLTHAKYTALLLRKHGRNPEYLRVFVRQQYTTILLVLCLLSVWLSPWVLCAYPPAVFYKAYRQHLDWKHLWQPIARDGVVLYAFFFFHPAAIPLRYTRVETM